MPVAAEPQASNIPDDNDGRRPIWRTVQWWPSLAGAAFAGYVGWDLVHGAELAAVVAASGLVYLAAAALQKPWAAWPTFLVTVVVIALGQVGILAIDPTWPLLALAGALFAYGLWARTRRPASGLPLQAVGMLVFGAVAGAAVILGGDAGGYLVAAGLLAHAAWDVHHHRANKAVVRSLAEFCCVLDIVLALVVLAVTIRN